MGRPLEDLRLGAVSPNLIMLLLHKVNPVMLDEYTRGGRPTGVAPIHMLCSGRDHEQERQMILREMIRLSASPSLKEMTKGASPLHRAAGSGAVETVRTLIELRGHINQPNDAGATPLDAAKKSSTEANG